MIKVATVFSGIGAIEQALKRMGLKHEIIFACDNGDIDIEYDQEEELKKIKKLKTKKEKKIYVENLYNDKSKKKNYVKQSYEANYKIKNNMFYNDINL